MDLNDSFSQNVFIFEPCRPTSYPYSTVTRPNPYNAVATFVQNKNFDQHRSKYNCTKFDAFYRKCTIWPNSSVSRPAKTQGRKFLKNI